MSTSGSYGTTDIEVRDPAKPSGNDDDEKIEAKPRCRLVLEPVIFLFILSITVQSATLPLYLYYRNGRQFNLTEDRAFVCNSSVDANSTEAILTKKVQEETSMWSAYRNGVTYGTALLVIPVYSSASDFFGRKVAMAIPCVGSFIDTCLSLLVAIFDLPLELLVVAGGFTGIGGGFGALFAGLFAYLADITDKKSRPLRTAILLSVYAVTSNLSQLGTGWLVRLTGYSVPFLVSTLAIGLCMLFVLLLVPEVRASRRRVTSCASLFLPMKGILDLFRLKWQLTLSLLLLLPAFGMYGGLFMGSQSVAALYQMNLPFCMDSVSIGYLETVRTVSFQIGVLLGTGLFEKRVGVVLLCGISMLSGIAYYCVTAFSTTVGWLYAACAAGLFAMIPIALLRSHMSQLLPNGRQGAIFSCVGLLDVGGALVGSLGLTLLYNGTLSWMPGFVYIVAAVGAAVAMVLTCLCAFTERRWPPAVEEDLSEEEGKE